MTPELQTIFTVSIPTLAVLIGILVNNSRWNDLNARFTDLGVQVNQRIEDLKETWRSELRRVEEVLDARLTHLEERMTSLEDRIS
ncbi:MAG TPA: hypothetical protein VGQ49_23740 [Bryobacteraceae bacterium]|jgi:hypothetical protein|nr:hypothetical protein [Bryobacteraceae bacterium]